MGHRTIDVKPCSPVIGAEIRGVDLTRPVSDDQFAEVHDAFLKHLVIFFRDQPGPMTPEQQVAFGRRFGDLHIHPAAPHLEGHPEVFFIHAHKDSKLANGETWHSDVSCDTEPPLGTILQIHLLPPSGGDTLFSNMLGAHVEQSKTPYVDYPVGTKDQPNEHGLDLTSAQLFELDSAVQSMRGKFRRLALRDVTIWPQLP